MKTKTEIQNMCMSGDHNRIDKETTQEKLIDAFEVKQFASDDSLKKFLNKNNMTWEGRFNSNPVFNDDELIGWAFSVYLPRYTTAMFVDFRKPIL